MTMKPPAPAPTLDAFTKWLETQPPDREYVWQDPVNCLVGTFNADHDRTWGEFAYSDIPHYDFIAGNRPWTCGAALERAKTLALPAPGMEVMIDGRIPQSDQEDQRAVAVDREAAGDQEMARLPAPGR